MSLGNVTENDILKALLRGIDPAWRSGATQYLALHTADPGEAGTAATNEANYTGYVRFPLNKASAWVDAGSIFTNATIILFPLCTAGSNTITHFSVVPAVNGAAQILVSGALNSPLSVVANSQPQFMIGSLSVNAD